MTIIYILILCFYLITCNGYYRLTMKEPALLECYNEYPKATVMSMMVFAALWPVVCTIVYFVHGLKK
jgi:hypothetical protein